MLASRCSTCAACRRGLPGQRLQAVGDLAVVRRLASQEQLADAHDEALGATEALLGRELVDAGQL